MNLDGLLIAVIHADRSPWNDIARYGQGGTWMRHLDATHAMAVYVHGRRTPSAVARLDHMHEKVRWTASFRRTPSRLLRVADALMTFPIRSWVPGYTEVPLGHLPARCLEVNVPDTYLTAPMKELSLFSYFMERTSATWLYMTTSSSYVRPMQVIKRASELGKVGVYAGTQLQAGRHTFVSGANRLLSRDVVQLFLEHRQHWDRSVLEDLGMGRLAAQLQIPISPLPTLNLDSVSEVESVPTSILGNNHHFRLKSGPLGRRNDVAVMRSLHQRIVAEGL